MLAPIIDNKEAIALLEQLLKSWQSGLCQPCLFHAKLGRALLEKLPAINSTEDFSIDVQQIIAWNSVIKSTPNKIGLDSNPYFYWFYPEAPELTIEIQQALFELYQPLYQHLQRLLE